MIWFHWMAILSAGICVISCMIHVSKLIRYGKPKDFSQQKGNLSDSLRYSISGAMSPKKKESAYLHLPTYTVGLLFHMGTFLSLFLFLILLTGIYPDGMLANLLAGFLVITGMSGMGILIKRMSQQKLRVLSNPDDYISNLLVSLVQLLTALTILNPDISAIYFVLISVLFLYLPVGKLKHTVYFFAARYHLGFFYGWRGVWPPKHQK